MNTIGQYKTLRTNGMLTGITVFVFSISLLNGCETVTHEQQGQVIGGVLGGVLGTQVGDGRGRTAAIIIGTLAGSMIGQHIGKSMDNKDRMQTAMALKDTPTGTTTSWVNADNGNHYALTPTRSFERGSNPCREFRLAATVGGQASQNSSGTACLQADGSWLLQ